MLAPRWIASTNGRASSSNAWRTTWSSSSRAGGCSSCVPSYEIRRGWRAISPGLGLSLRSPRTHAVEKAPARHARGNTNAGLDAQITPYLLVATNATPDFTTSSTAAGGPSLPRFPGLGAGSARIPSRGRKQGSPRADLAGPSCTQGAAPSSTRTRSQSGTRRHPAAASGGPPGAAAGRPLPERQPSPADYCFWRLRAHDSPAS